MTDPIDDSSPPKRTRKAGTRRRSTTSSTTALPQPPRLLEGELLTDAAPFTLTEQRAVLDLIVRGASPHRACQQLQIDIDRFWATYRTDSGFAKSLDQVYETLTLNVVAGLYRTAMEGNVVAQRLWLQHRQTVAWSRAGISPEPDWENVTDEQIRELFGQEQWAQQARRLEGTSPP